MDFPDLNSLPTDPGSWLGIGIFVLSLALVFLVSYSAGLLRNDAEHVDFKVPIPEQCGLQWRGLELDDPAIKVSRHRATDCGRQC